MVYQIHLRTLHGQVRVFPGHGEVDHVGQRARELCSGRTAADDDEVQRALLDQA
jgi:hypothetical protein